MDGACPLLRQPDGSKGFVHSPGNLQRGNAQVLGSEGDLVLNSSLNELGIRVLEDDSDASCDLSNLCFKRIHASDANNPLPLSTANARKVTIQKLAQGGLSTSAPAGYGDPLPWLHKERQVIQGRPCLHLIRIGHVFKLDYRSFQDLSSLSPADREPSQQLGSD
nr:hypothetical protein [Paenibacillus zeisoli]